MRRDRKTCVWIIAFMFAFLFSGFVFSEDSTQQAPAKVKKGLYAEGTPTRAIQDLDAKLDDFKVRVGGKPLSPEDREFNRKLKQNIIHGTFDIAELAKLSLGKHWEPRTPKERDEFIKLLTDLLEERALFAKEQSAAKSKSGGKYFVAYKGSKDIGKDRAFVMTRVTVPSENITINLNYKMKKKDNEWMIYDIIVDEASLVDNYRYQFNSIITKHGYPDLVGRMSSKLDQIKKDRDGEAE